MSINTLGMNWRRFLGALLLGLAFGATALAQVPAGGIIVSDFKGILRIRVGTGDPQVVANGQMIPLGARIVTGADSRAVLTFPDGQVVALGANSRVIVREFRYFPNDIGKSRIVLNLTDGSARVVMGAIGQHDPGLVQIQIGTKTTAQTPNLPRDGELALVMLGTQTLVLVDQGKVSLRVAGESYPLASGEGALVGADGFVQVGSIAFLERLTRGSAGDRMMSDAFREMLLFKFPHSTRQIMVTLTAPNSGEGPEEDRVRAEALITTSATGAVAGGGTPGGSVSPN